MRQRARRVQVLSLRQRFLGYGGALAYVLLVVGNGGWQARKLRAGEVVASFEDSWQLAYESAGYNCLLSRRPLYA